MVLIYKVIISRVLSHCFEFQFSTTVRFSILEYFLLHKISSLFIFLFRRCRRCVREINLCPRVQFQGWWHAWEMRYLPFYHSMTVSHLYCYRQQFVWNFRTKLMPLKSMQRWYLLSEYAPIGWFTGISPTCGQMKSTAYISLWITRGDVEVFW